MVQQVRIAANEAKKKLDVLWDTLRAWLGIVRDTQDSQLETAGTVAEPFQQKRMNELCESAIQDQENQLIKQSHPFQPFSLADCDPSFVDHLSVLIMARHKFSHVLNAITNISSLTSPSVINRDFLDFISPYYLAIQCFIRLNPDLAFQRFLPLLDVSELTSVLLAPIKTAPFEKRREWFYTALHQKPLEDSVWIDSSSMMVVDRNNIFETSCDSVMSLAPEVEQLYEFHSILLFFLFGKILRQKNTNMRI